MARTMAGCSGLSASRASSGARSGPPGPRRGERRPVVRLARLAVPLAVGVDRPLQRLVVVAAGLVQASGVPIAGVRSGRGTRKLWSARQSITM